MTDKLKETIREAGGIVHGDGNIFFTNAEQFLAAAGEAVAGAIDARGREDLLDYAQTFGAVLSDASGLVSFEPFELERFVAALASREQSPASPDAGAGAVAEPPKGDIPPVSNAERGLTDAERSMLNTLFSNMSDLSDKEWRDHGFRRATFDRLQNKLSGFLYPVRSAAPASAPEPPEPQGAREVEEQVTEGMIEAGAKAAREYMQRTGGNDPAVIYRAMRRAALAQAAPATGKVDAVSEVADAINDLRGLHAQTTPGDWGKGQTTHHTVSRRKGQEPYRIAEFHHANDAAFCDAAHALFPLLLEALATPAPTVQAETGEEPSVLDFRCPHCDSQPGVPCVGTAGGTHLERREAFCVALTAVQADTKGGEA